MPPIKVLVFVGIIILIFVVGFLLRDPSEVTQLPPDNHSHAPGTPEHRH